MNIVIAMDSFKGSLASIEAGRAVQVAAQSLLPESNITVFPLADGGEGTVDALTEGLGGKILPAKVTGPLGAMIDSRWGFLPQTKTAVIEMADASGLPLVPQEKRNPLQTTTFGLGTLILEAAQKGCRNFIIGLGGSATNDCGLGMLTAFGIRFLDSEQKPVGIFGRDLENVTFINLQNFAPVLRSCHFHVACDVRNPLTGANGCSAVYGPQKGATPAIVARMDASISAFASLTEKTLHKQGANIAGAGAAGGLGFALHMFLNAQLAPGISLVLDAIHMNKALATADLFITGEGRMDSQSAMGKAPVGAAQLAKKCQPHIMTVALCGAALSGAEAVNPAGIDAFFPILHTPMSVDEAMQKEVTRSNLQATTAQILHLIQRAQAVIKK